MSGGRELEYLDDGIGPVALVIGSARYASRTFSYSLRRHLRMVFCDHLGFAPTKGVGSYGLDQVLHDIECIRRVLGLGRVIIVAYSDHGRMALEYARRFPDNVSHVVMIGTAPSYGPDMAPLIEKRWSETAEPARKAQFERDKHDLLQEMDEAPERRFITSNLRLAARSWFDPTFDARSLWRGVAVDMPAIDHLWAELLLASDIQQGLATFPAPVFLAVGRFDFLSAPVEAWDPVRPVFSDFTIKMFERSGHCPQFEEPEAFDCALLDWLRPVSSI